MKSIIFFALFLLILSACKNKPDSTAVDQTTVRKEIIADDTSDVKYGVIYHKACQFDDLSDVYDYHVDFSRVYKTKRDDDTTPGCHITISVLRRSGQIPIDTIRLDSYYIFSAFEDCLHGRSYISGKNADSMPNDNNYGEIVVGDYNFDNKEDIAVINDSGGNSGPTYNFYLEDGQGRFILDHFLTDSMQLFPGQINKQKKTLVTYGHANCCSVCVSTFAPDSKTNKWTRINRKFVNTP